MSKHRATIVSSLKELNPALFDSLSAEGGLSRYAEQCDLALMEATAALEETLLAASPAPEAYLPRVRHFNGLRQQAEEICLHDMLQSFCPMPQEG